MFETLKNLLGFYGPDSKAVIWAHNSHVGNALATEMAARREHNWAAILTLGFIILTGYTSINAVVKAVMFPTHVRALGVGFGYAVANSCFGGTAPVLYAAAKSSGHVQMFVIYVTVLIAASLLVYLFLLRNRGANWLDAPDEMRRRKNSNEHRIFPMGV